MLPKGGRGRWRFALSLIISNKEERKRGGENWFFLAESTVPPPLVEKGGVSVGEMVFPPERRKRKGGIAGPRSFSQGGCTG